MISFIAHTDDIRQELLKEISCSSIDELFERIPVKFENFNMSSALSEFETQKKIKALAKRNKTENISFLGGGMEPS